MEYNRFKHDLPCQWNKPKTDPSHPAFLFRISRPASQRPVNKKTENTNEIMFLITHIIFHRTRGLYGLVVTLIRVSDGNPSQA